MSQAAARAMASVGEAGALFGIASWPAASQAAFGAVMAILEAGIERKLAVALVAAAARGASRGGQAAGGGGGSPGFCELRERLLEEAARAVGKEGKLTPGSLRRELILRGRRDLVKEAEGVQRARRSAARPPSLTVIDRVVSALLVEVVRTEETPTVEPVGEVADAGFGIDFYIGEERAEVGVQVGGGLGTGGAAVGELQADAAAGPSCIEAGVSASQHEQLLQVPEQLPRVMASPPPPPESAAEGLPPQLLASP